MLFRSGLGALQCDCLVRVREPREVARLRAACGTSLLANDAAMLGEIAMMSPQRVFASRLGRIEVFQPIPAPDGVSPEGPHTHVLPRLLKAGRTHAATLPIPDGLVPCLELHLPAGLDHIFDRYPEFADVTRDWCHQFMDRYVLNPRQYPAFQRPAPITA